MVNIKVGDTFRFSSKDRKTQMIEIEKIEKDIIYYKLTNFEISPFRTFDSSLRGFGNYPQSGRVVARYCSLETFRIDLESGCIFKTTELDKELYL